MNEQKAFEAGSPGSLPSEEQRARSIGLRLLSVRSRTESEVRRRLEERGFQSASVESAIEWLKSLGYLDDRAYAERFVESKTRTRPIGPMRIARELRQKGIDAGTIGEALGSIGPDEEFQLARKAAEQWLRRQGGGDPRQAFRRLASHLDRRGFSRDAIRRAARETLSLDIDD